MFQKAELLKRYCKECGNVTHLQPKITTKAVIPQFLVYAIVSTMIVAVLGLVKLLVL